MLAHRSRRPGLVLAHQSGITHDVDGHDRGESPVFGHCTLNLLASLAQARSRQGRSSFQVSLNPLIVFCSVQLRALQKQRLKWSKPLTWS